MLEKEGKCIIICALFFAYSFLAVVVFNSLFQGYLKIITIGFAVLFSFYIPINHKKIDATFSTIFQFSMSVVGIVLMLLTFVLVTGKEMIPNEFISNASYTIGWLMILLFGTAIFSLIGKNFQKKNYRKMSLRFAIFMFILGFTVLVSFISGITFL